MVAASLLTQATLLLTLAIAISAKPVLERKSPMKLALTKRLSLSNNNVMERDLLQKGSGSGSVNLNNTPAFDKGVRYTVIVGVGNPPTNYTLLVDTGSSNTWIGAITPYVKTNTSQPTGNNVFAFYGSGNFSGVEFIDQVTIGSDLVITNQSIGVASSSRGFPGVDGILGIGPTDLTLDTLFPDNNTLIPTVTDNLFASHAISEHLVAVSFEPSNTSSSELNGELSWGVTDSSKFIDPITYTPIFSGIPGWVINATVTYGLNTTSTESTAGLVDTGTTLLYLAPDALNDYKETIGAVFDNGTNLFTITPAQYGNLQDLNFLVSGVTFTLIPDAQIWPRKLNTFLIGGVASQIYLIVAELGPEDVQEGLSFIFGMVALQRFYAVFDTANKQIGLANTPFTNVTVNFNSTLSISTLTST